MDMLRAGEPAAGGLAIYHRAVRANRHGALCAAYPVVRRLVGEAFFEALAGAYAEAHPSRSGDLHGFGAELAAFVEGHAAASGLDYLGDVARLEWALHESDQAADAPAFDFAALSSVPAERQGALRPRMHPAARLLRARHDVVGIWEANQPGRDGTPGPLRPSAHVLVTRPAFHPLPQRLDAAEGRLLEQVAAGATLDQCCAALAEEAPRLGEILARHVEAGALCGFDGLA